MVLVSAYEEGKGGRERETWMVRAYEEGKGGERERNIDGLGL